MMIEPARSDLPLSVKSSSAACIFTAALAKRNLIRLLSVVCSTTMTGPEPSIPPGARTSRVTGVIACARIDESVTGVT